MLKGMPIVCDLTLWTIRFDIGAMLRHRCWYSHSRPAFRYLAYDASPQAGTELFGTVERIVLLKDIVEQLICDSLYPSSVTQRKLPICQLGTCRLGRAEKAATLIHQTWLEYGPSQAEVQLANLDVRPCLTDMGTEIDIAEMADMPGACLPCVTLPPAAQPVGAAAQWLFPHCAWHSRLPTCS